MKLYFKQRFFSWFDSYDIYDYDTGDVVYTVEGQLAWGHCLHILDADGRHIATVKQRVLTFLPKFDLYLGDACIGTICKEFTIVRPQFTLDCNGWQVEGDFMGWEYEITDGQRQVAAISKGAAPLDGYLRHRRGRRAGWAVRPDGSAGHRRRKMFPQQLRGLAVFCEFC